MFNRLFTIFCVSIIYLIMTNEERTKIYENGAYTEPKDGDMWEFSDGVFYYSEGVWYSET